MATVIGSIVPAATCAAPWKSIRDQVYLSEFSEFKYAAICPIDIDGAPGDDALIGIFRNIRGFEVRNPMHEFFL